jgi:hypothetical protein
MASKSYKELEKMAPWPGFEPGSGGRQPPILDRTILPGHTPLNTMKCAKRIEAKC